MAPTIQSLAKPSDRLALDRLEKTPADIQFMILQYTSSHDDLLSLMQAYPEWVMPLWKDYPRQLFQQAWDNILSEIAPSVGVEAVIAYHVRNIRKQYATAMEHRHETQEDRDGLEKSLRDVLDPNSDELPELNQSLDTILGFGDVIRDVNSLTDRYSNDAWNRIRDIARKTGTMPTSPADNRNLPAIQLTAVEREGFQLAFLRVEIYLLTKYWTNNEEERHMIDVGAHIEPFIPHHIEWDMPRRKFDSCIRYIFHAYRQHLKKTAKELKVPQLPDRDDLPWVQNWYEGSKYEHPDYIVQTTSDTVTKFAQRSISEEQGFLLWLCEFGIGPLVQTHNAEDTVRREEVLRQFSRRHIWETVELRHQFSRYDVLIDQLPPGISPNDAAYQFIPRNKHPVMSLYGQDEHQSYATSSYSAAWACASRFLIWRFKIENMVMVRNLRVRGDITLNDHGRWITFSDTDRGMSPWNHLWCTDPNAPRNAVPHGHPYMFDPVKYEFRSQPTRIHMITP
ncbi:hypothetical protein Daus18300_008114 [Diaporthe australafricana]|uniref:Uncharacterized protein n=1 Tax=Diaporthe australafricana TaxID=127596 RepID=A0ABR3WJG2_9PEZI